MAVSLFRLPFFWKEKVPPVSTKKNLVETDKHCFQFPPLVRGGEIAKRKKKKLKTVFQFQFPCTVRTGLRASFRPSPDINQKIEESKNRRIEELKD
jgi:hypothetical protein